MRTRRIAADTPAALVPLSDAVDLIRFEKNLLQIGFFGAHDTRHNNQSTRRIEQWVNRDGQKIRVSAEFRGSAALGLPSTSDRDKFIAFMKIAMDRRALLGRIENPIRFTGYQMLKELGLSFSGENYEDINRWGQRMADTTISSEQVIYLAVRKRYANQTVHVFRSFRRAGQSDLEDSGRAEHYEVVLEDWLLENLNQSYVVPEDFNSYRKLKRPTAKGIFGYLHLWFHASQGRPVEKNYAELCTLLNIPAYRYISKIKETMGRSLDELVDIGYLARWDVCNMVTKQGFKLVMHPGTELLGVLANSQRKIGQETDSAEVQLSGRQAAALQALLDRGVMKTKALALLRGQNPDVIIDQVEFAEFLIAKDKRGKIENPAGFIIYMIENGGPVPANFPSSRRIRDRQAAAGSEDEAYGNRIRLEEAYNTFVQGEVEAELARRLPGDERERRIKEVIRDRGREDPVFFSMHREAQREFAERSLWAEVRQEVTLPSFDEWKDSARQLDLFRGGTA